MKLTLNSDQYEPTIALCKSHVKLLKYMDLMVNVDLEIHPWCVCVSRFLFVYVVVYYCRCLETARGAGGTRARPGPAPGIYIIACFKQI